MRLGLGIALLAVAMVSLHGCKQMPASHLDGTGATVSAPVPVEDNVTRISATVVRTRDEENKVSCYTYENHKSLHHSISCIKDD